METVAKNYDWAMGIKSIVKDGVRVSFFGDYGYEMSVQMVGEFLETFEQLDLKNMSLMDVARKLLHCAKGEYIQIIRPWRYIIGERGYTIATVSKE